MLLFHDCCSTNHSVSRSSDALATCHSFPVTDSIVPPAHVVSLPPRERSYDEVRGSCPRAYVLETPRNATTSARVSSSSTSSLNADPLHGPRCSRDATCPELWCPGGVCNVHRRNAASYPCTYEPSSVREPTEPNSEPILGLALEIEKGQLHVEVTQASHVCPTTSLYHSTTVPTMKRL